MQTQRRPYSWMDNIVPIAKHGPLKVNRKLEKFRKTLKGVYFDIFGRARNASQDCLIESVMNVKVAKERSRVHDSGKTKAFSSKLVEIKNQYQI